MTEEKWLAATDPVSMLEFLGQRISVRKLRLFSVAYCRRIWDILDDPAYREAVEVAERYADGIADAGQLDAAWRRASGVSSGPPLRRRERNGWQELDQHHPDILHHAQGHAAVRAAISDDRLWFLITRGGQAFMVRRNLPAEARAECDLLREVLGILLFRPVTIDLFWLSWSDATVPKIAHSIYSDRRFDELPILADALEEAGCSDPDILGHCRGPGPHVRGCWVVDLILGRS